jgi:anaerobic selenocysteine-containing dehydrogenase
MATVTRTCNVCEAMCGLEMTVERGRITGVRADRQDVFSRGHICPKGPALKEVLEDPDRLRYPIRRTASGWERIGYEQAIELAGREIRRLQKEHGNDSVGLYIGNPTVHNHGTVTYMQGFAKALSSKNRFDANSQDANPKLLSCMWMFGDLLSIPIPDVDRTSYLLMLGANPAASNGSLMTLGDVRGRMKGIKERGGKWVLIDPRRTESAEWASEHHFIRPGGDAAFLLALIHVLFAEDLVRRTALRETERGVDELEAIARRFTPERVEKAIGIGAETIRRIARELAAAESAVVYGRIGTCQNEFAVTASWLIDAINVITHNFDRPGGAMFSSPAVDVAQLGRKLVGNRYGRWRSRVRGLPELGGQLPASVMAEEMETPGRGQIRGMVTIAGNPVLSVPSGERLAKALSGLDFMVSLDIYQNETTRHAHLIIPPTHTLEQSHYDLVLSAFAVRNIAKYSEPVVEPPRDGREDWQILTDLANELGGLDFGVAPVNAAMKLLSRWGIQPSPDRLLDLMIRMGPYGDKLVPWSKGLSLDKIRKAPHGIDLGPLRPCRAERVHTEGHRVDLVPRALADDLPRLERWIDERSAPDSLVLIGRRHVRTNNSWMHNVQSLVKGPDRSQLLMHPSDAERRSIAKGDRVRVESRTGAIEVRVEITDDIMPGVVSLPHGYGHAVARDSLQRAGALEGPNVNAITDDARVEPIAGTAILNGVPVEVSRVAATVASGEAAE